MRVATEEKHTKASPTINKLSTHFEMSNLADGKSESTITWYNDILKLFSRYLKDNVGSDNIKGFGIENAREYVLFLRSRKKFGKYTNAQVQHSGLSPQTVRGHIRGLKAFSSWLYL
jgi:site-specific recombinase XerD